MDASNTQPRDEIRRELSRFRTRCERLEKEREKSRNIIRSLRTECVAFQYRIEELEAENAELKENCLFTSSLTTGPGFAIQAQRQKQPSPVQRPPSSMSTSQLTPPVSPLQTRHHAATHVERNFRDLSLEEQSVTGIEEITVLESSNKRAASPTSEEPIKPSKLARTQGLKRVHFALDANEELPLSYVRGEIDSSHRDISATHVQASPDADNSISESHTICQDVDDVLKSVEMHCGSDRSWPSITKHKNSSLKSSLTKKSRQRPLGTSLRRKKTRWDPKAGRRVPVSSLQIEEEDEDEHLANPLSDWPKQLDYISNTSREFSLPSDIRVINVHPETI